MCVSLVFWVPQDQQPDGMQRPLALDSTQRWIQAAEQSPARRERNSEQQKQQKVTGHNDRVYHTKWNTCTHVRTCTCSTPVFKYMCTCIQWFSTNQITNRGKNTLNEPIQAPSAHVQLYVHVHVCTLYMFVTLTRVGSGLTLGCLVLLLTLEGVTGVGTIFWERGGTEEGGSSAILSFLIEAVNRDGTIRDCSWNTCTVHVSKYMYMHVYMYSNIQVWIHHILCVPYLYM